MMWVVDASVAIKCFFQGRDNETDGDLALSILENGTYCRKPTAKPQQALKLLWINHHEP